MSGSLQKRTQMRAYSAGRENERRHVSGLRSLTANMLVSVQADWFIRSRRTAPMLARTDSVAAIAKNWLAQFDRALAAADGARLDTMFHAESHWRDVLALTWQIRTISGRNAVLRELAAHARRARP